MYCQLNWWSFLQVLVCYKSTGILVKTKQQIPFLKRIATSFLVLIRFVYKNNNHTNNKRIFNQTMWDLEWMNWPCIIYLMITNLVNMFLLLTSRPTDSKPPFFSSIFYISTSLKQIQTYLILFLLICTGFCTIMLRLSEMKKAKFTVVISYQVQKLEVFCLQMQTTFSVEDNHWCLARSS